MDRGEDTSGAPSRGGPRTQTLPEGDGGRRQPGAPGSGGRRTGEALGRYVLLDLLGAGGMGEVYAAYDRRLDRKVALKLLRPDRAGDRQAARLLREAQALARLAHPNVVTVHDVGVFDDGVFVAMEFVDGPTLRRWLEEEPRPWRRVVEVFLAAGRGLAAVHEAGLVHRDFKPDNVMLRPDGRVLVMDFGLARPAAADRDPDEGASPAELPGEAGRRALGSSLTETGTVLGTPAYMAPEQLRGDPADARSDQYSFCVALREALQPDDGAEGEGTGGARRAVPRWLRRVLERGTARDPMDRFRSVAELLAALAWGVGARRRRGLAAAGLAVAAIALGGFGPWATARAARCAGGEERLAAVWSADRRQGLEAAFVATGSPFAATSWRAVALRVDGWASRWLDTRRSACEATAVRREQSPELLDRRMACLDRRLRGTGAVLDLLARADRAMIERAVSVVEGLPDPGECSAVESLLGRPAPPAGPAAREAMATVEEDLAEVEALVRLSRAPEAIVLGEDAVARARRLDYPPLLAEALVALGVARLETEDGEEAESVLYEALLAAEAGGDDSLLGHAASQLVWAVGFTQGETEEAVRWAGLAEAALRRLGADEALESELRTNRGLLLYMQGDYPAAIDDLRRAVAIDERLHGADSLELGSTLNNLAVPQLQGGRFAEAETTLRRSLAIQEQTLGRGHPTTGDTVVNLATAASNLGRLEEAVALSRRSLDLLRQAHGPEHPEVATALSNLGSHLFELGELEESLDLELQALALRRKLYGAVHPFVGISHNNLGRTYRELGRYPEALAAYREAAAVLEASAGADHPLMAYALNGIGLTWLRQGRPELAVEPLERAAAIRRGAETPPGELGLTLFLLARSLGETGGDPGRTLELAREAEGLLAAGGRRFENTHREARAWLEARG